MKTRLLKRLRQEARREYVHDYLIDFVKLLYMAGDELAIWIMKERRNYILRRVADLKQKRK